MIWNEEQLREELGVDGYAWFVAKAMPRLAACPYCQGSCKVTMPNDILNETWAKEGKTTNFTKVEACRSCHEYIGRLTTFVRIWIRTVPPAYRAFTLRTLAPKDGLSVPVDRQRKVMDFLRANPDQGYAFFGPPQAGKTVMTTALYTEALWNETVRAPQYDYKAQKFFPLWRISTKKLLDEHTDWTMHRNDKESESGPIVLGVPYPTVTVEKIAYVRQYGRTPRLFLEELDKVKETEARRYNLFEILNAMHDYQGVLVVNSNYTLEEFATQFGDDFAWRIKEACKIVNLFE
jgi:hypothetical protein